MDELALLAERGSRAVRDEPAIRHLARCRSCMAAYADAVRYRAAWLASPGMFQGDAAPPVALPDTRYPRAAGFALAAGLVAVLGIGAFLVSQRPSPREAAAGPIAALLEEASSVDFVYPGWERGAALRSPSYRSGTAQSEDVRVAIEGLRTRYESGSRSATGLYELAAALTAAGHSDLAHDYVSEGRALHPENPRFLVLAAILERRQGNADEAARLLRKARRLAPDDLTVMLDHAILLSESGALVEAEPLLREVIRRSPGSPLAARAERMLQGSATR